MPSFYDYLRADDCAYYIEKHASLFKKHANAYQEKEREEKENGSLRNR